MTWELQVDYPLPSLPDDSWILVPVLLDVEALAYGFRLKIPNGLPSTWNTAGYWCWCQDATGEWVHSELHTIPLLSIGGEQVITLLGANQTDVLGVGPNIYAIAISVNKWVPRNSVEILVLKP
jgi:hypothetical protein